MKLLHLTWIAALGISACNSSKNPNFEYDMDMMESPAIKAQEYDEGSPAHRGMRVPPENTVPQGFVPYKYGFDAEAAKENKNPLAGEMDEETLGVGIKYYETNCMLCHGMHGEGGEINNSIGEKMARKPPGLLTDRVRAMSDGQIYHIITKGLGVMGPYDSQIPQASRWQVVNYIRHLQNENKATK